MWGRVPRSHPRKLFAWGVEVTKGLYEAVINSSAAKMQAFQPFLDHNFRNLFS
jgi:hypothetical protein